MKNGAHSNFDENAALDSRVRSDPVAMCVVHLVNAIKADFGHKFQSQFGDGDSLRLYKRRLYSKLKNFDPVDVYDGYDEFVDATPRPEWPPTIPQLTAAIESASLERKRAGWRIEESRLKALSPPSIRANAVDLPSMLARARLDMDSMSHDDTLRRHEALIAGMKPLPKPGHQPCHVIGCGAAGVVSSDTRGGGAFYCPDHFYRKTID